MSRRYRLLLVEDEPLILMDLEFAAEDRGCAAHCATSCGRALAIIDEVHDGIDAAVLDVSLGQGETCFPIADALRERNIPFILHSGDLDRHDEHIRSMNATLVAKPAAAAKVIGAAIACVDGGKTDDGRLAAQ